MDGLLFESLGKLRWFGGGGNGLGSGEVEFYGTVFGIREFDYCEWFPMFGLGD